ncbi:MAG: MarR family transcriptional regulator [Rhodospirillales bacterium]|nr:MarR family transcriptional regulator [Rhodospirillales bacterium]
MRGTNLVLARLRRGLHEEFGISLATFDLLMQVLHPPAGPTLSELSRRLMVTKGNVSELVKRMEAKGLIERRSDPDDARQQHVHLTKAGAALSARILPRQQAWMAAMMAEMDGAGQQILYESLGAFISSVVAEEQRELRERRRRRVAAIRGDKANDASTTRARARTRRIT